MKRRHSLYLNPITSGPLIIMRAPDEFVRWVDLRRAILTALRQDFGLRARDVHAIEGLAGYAYQPDDADSVRFAARVDRGLAGDPEPVAGFHLYAWEAGAFQRKRAGVEPG